MADMTAERLCSRVPPLVSHEVFSFEKAASAIRLLTDESVVHWAPRHAGHVEVSISFDCIRYVHSGLVSVTGDASRKSC